MTRRLYLLLGGTSLVFLCAQIFLANNMYWSATPATAGGEYILFHRTTPQPYGYLLSLILKPAMLATTVAVIWFFYRWNKLRREGPPAGLCQVCGYDIRATPERCPECGTPVPPKSNSFSGSGVT